ncbi:MAG: serine hydrolase domain-containing protein [Terriglobales bacterium]
MTGKLSRTAVIVIVACVLLSCGMASGQKLADSLVANRLEAYLKPFVETGNFTGVVLVARKGRVLFRRSYGMANYELQVPNSPATRFHIASVSKPFTAMAILQLQEQGRLNVSDPVSRFVPGFPNGDRITLEHLLTHTSGIPNVNDLPDYDTFARSPHTVEQLIGKFSTLPLDFQPGADYHYSNSNYNLLALILEKVSGESYGDYVRQHIFDPAGMTNSGHDGEALRLIPLAASGYEPAGVSSYEKAPYLDWSNKTGNGSLYSTVDDLYRFDRALNSDTLLKSATRQKYFVEGRGNRFGWFNRSRSGHRVMSSNGRSPGFTAQLDRFPDDDVTVIVLSNSYATVSQDPIAAALAAIVLGEQPEKPPALRAIDIPQPTLASYAGDYQYGPDYFVPNAKFTLTAEGGTLLLELGSFRTPLVPLSATEFLERNFLGHVVISVGPGGRVDSLTYRYAGKDFVAHRVKAK